VDEIHSLSVLQFLGMHPDPNAPHLDQALVVTGKGGRSRHVAIPGWLVEDALAYISGEREVALKCGKVSNRTASNFLFLSGVGSKRPGRPISIRRLQQIIETSCLAIGLTKSIEVRDAETGSVSLKRMQKHSVHDLRHTAAVLIYHAERRAGNSEPWKKVQMQLGHKHLQTTIDTYLHHVEIFGQQQQFYDVRKMIGL
jgi:integrase